MPVVNPDVADVRIGVIRQWELIADAVDLIELSAARGTTSHQLFVSSPTRWGTI
jgi:hypothetical protein